MHALKNKNDNHHGKKQNENQKKKLKIEILTFNDNWRSILPCQIIVIFISALTPDNSNIMSMVSNFKTFKVNILYILKTSKQTV